MRTQTTLAAAAVLAAGALFGMLAGPRSAAQAPPAGAKEAATPEEIRAIAKEAYLYGFAMMENYHTWYP